MITLSGIMIVKNEEKVIRDSIESFLPFLDELIIVDTGSSDNTINIAKEYTNNVHTIEWIDNFSYARNKAIDLVTKDYFIWFDADDYIEKKDQDKIKVLKEQIKDENMILLPYKCSESFSYYRERIIKKSPLNTFEGIVHETIPLRGKLRYENIPIIHKKIGGHSNRNLLIYENLLKRRPLKTRELYYYGNELLDNGFYNQALSIYSQFLDDKNGYYINKIDACIKMFNIYKYFLQPNNAKNILFYSLKLGYPTPRQYFEIGKLFFDEKDYETAILYFKQCPNLKVNPLAFSSSEYEKYLPYIYLSLCYYHLKDNKKALSYNDLALLIKPNDELALSNKKYYL